MTAESRRADFSEAVKEQLAGRAGHRCSYPDCRAQTSGPSESRSSGVSNVGVAAHIVSAVPGGIRDDASFSIEQRQGYDNGIWLCQTHAKAIDDDEVRFSRQLLVAWRVRAEEAANREKGIPILAFAGAESRLLASHARQFDGDRDRLRTGIHEFLVDIGARRVWGPLYDLARMVLYELALNAVDHGGAETVDVHSEAGIVALRYGGRRFGIDELRSGGNGGHQAAADLETDAQGTFSLVYRWSAEVNEWCLIDQVVADGANTPCGVAAPGLGRNEVESVVEKLRGPMMAGCPEIHFYPGHLWSYSDWGPVLRRLVNELEGRVLVVHGVAADSQMARLIRRHVPEARLPD